VTGRLPAPSFTLRELPSHVQATAKGRQARYASLVTPDLCLNPILIVAVSLCHPHRDDRPGSVRQPPSLPRGPVFSLYFTGKPQWTAPLQGDTKRRRRSQGFTCDRPASFGRALALPSVEAFAARGGAFAPGATFRPGPTHVVSLGPVGIVHRQDQSSHQGAGVAPKDTSRPARGRLVHRTYLQIRQALPSKALSIDPHLNDRCPPR
jgi:hypothetical protein